MRGAQGWWGTGDQGGPQGFGDTRHLGTRTLSPLAPGRPAAPRSPGIPCRPGGPWFPGAPGAPASPWERGKTGISEIPAQQIHPGLSPSPGGEAKPSHLHTRAPQAGDSPRRSPPGTYLSTIVTGSTVSTTRTLGTGGALDTAFSRESSLTLGRGGRTGPEAVRGVWGTLGCREFRGTRRGSAYPGTGGTGGSGISRDTLSGRERVTSQRGTGGTGDTGDGQRGPRGPSFPG